MEIRDRYSRGSSRSRGSSSASEVDPREKIKDFCRKIVAFMCTQVGMGFLVVGYTLVGAASFMYIEKDADNPKLDEIVKVRSEYAEKLYDVAIFCNTFDKKNFTDEADIVLKTYQDTVVKILRHGYEDREMVEVWTFPAALMFSLGIITMIGFETLYQKPSMEN
ncbi:hypothetical protein JTB14_019140 [Gonioctena quinquepunctata]|nr:hypothetical protein JTB14_019140 [Gonioctena quinquepunctata]